MRNVPMSEWGKDHWSCFGYVLSCYVGGSGYIDSSRINKDGHVYPTRLKNGVEPGHNELNCIDDFEAEGLIVNEGTGITPRIHVTEKGWAVGRKLSEHKYQGKNFIDFEWKE
jgi:hypothetical protein